MGPDPDCRARQPRERSSWRDFLSGLKARGLAGVDFVVSDNHEGLKAAIRKVLPGTAWQRSCVHFLRNALDYVPRNVDDDCLQELRWFYDWRDIAQWLAKWQAKYPRLYNWVEDNIAETLTYYRLPLPQRFVYEPLEFFHLLGEFDPQRLRPLAFGVQAPLAIDRIQPFQVLHVARGQRALEHPFGIVGRLVVGTRTLNDAVNLAGVMLRWRRRPWRRRRQGVVRISGRTRQIASVLRQSCYSPAGKRPVVTSNKEGEKHGV